VHWNANYRINAFELIYSGQTEDHFFKIYTSAVLKKLKISEQAQKQFLDIMIDSLGANTTLKIRQIHTGKQGDITIGIEDPK
jgi:hypothetical protein